MIFFFQTNNTPSANICKNDGGGGEGGGGPKFVYPEMADDFIVENEKFWYS